MPIRVATIVARFLVDKHNYMCTQGENVHETGSVMKVRPKDGPISSYDVVKYPTAYLDWDAKMPEEYKPDTLACMLHDNKTSVRQDEIVKVLSLSLSLSLSIYPSPASP